MPASPISTTDVLIVGAGPAGLATALGLAKAGIKTRIVDIKAERVAAGHADGIMPRTVEILQSYGLADDLLKKGHSAYMICNYNHDPASGGIKFAGKLPVINEPSARYQCCVTQHQGFVEGLLLSALEEAGVRVERPCKPTALEISSPDAPDAQAHPVTVTLEHLAAAPGTPPPTETVHAKYVVGADGAHSWVRHALGIRMEGDSTARVWGAIDFTPDPASTFPDWRNLATVNAAGAGVMLIPREAGKVRLYIELGTEAELPRDARGRPDTAACTPARLLAIARAAFAPYTLEPAPGAVEWWTAYIVGQRVAERFAERRRAFIVGDACHTHSPKGGQGMNVSIGDGHNLAWKLAHVLHGWSPPALLDTYEAERRPLAQELIAFDRWFAEGFSAHARAALLAQDRTVALPGPLEAFRTFSALTTGVGVRYAPSRITAAAAAAAHGDAPPGALTPGKRVPPRALVRVADRNAVDLQDALACGGARGTLLVFAGDAAHAAHAAGALRGLLGMRACAPARAAVVVVLARAGDETTYRDVPAALRADWTRILVDAASPFSNAPGGAYEALGVPPGGAVVFVRPDGVVGAMAGLGEVQKIEEYLTGWMI